MLIKVSTFRIQTQSVTMPEQTRQLAAIMFTDIVGYTALMGRDEQKAMQLLEQNRQGHHLKKRNFKTNGKSC